MFERKIEEKNGIKKKIPKWESRKRIKNIRGEQRKIEKGIEIKRRKLIISNVYR